MGNYTRINLVRSGSGYGAILTPSGTVNFSIKRGEGAMKKYLGVTPVTGSQTEAWVEDAATSFAIHYLALRLVTQNIANAQYQGQVRQAGGAKFKGNAIASDIWWAEGVRLCDLHGRNIIIQRIQPT